MPPPATPGRDHAASWFSEAAAAAYEQGRPEYPLRAGDVLTEQLVLRPGRRVLDVAAGTGKLTRLLVQGPARVLAVEPMPGMRAELRRAVPDAQLLAGTAEALPLANGSLDAVTVAQAFHWFRVPEASRELRRVLCPGGRLAIITNLRHEPEAWVKRLWHVLADYERLAPRPESTRGWREALDRTGDFGTFERFDVANQQHFADLADFDARFTSISFVIQLDPDRRVALLRDLHEIVGDVHPLVIPMRTVIEVATRRG
jgi:SAM-dependent methyltransferase